MLAAAALDRIQSARRLIAGLEALGELAALLRAERPRTAWELAGEIASARRAFERSGAWPRIRDGHREPRDRHEELLAAIVQARLPDTQRWLYPLLAD